jgi:5-methylcytosine-specific restriction protein A
MRSVDEWIAKHDDQAIPPRVRLRIFERYQGICQLSKRKIMAGDKWQADHIKALWRGGEHRETNLWPVLVEPHKVKSSEERSVQAKCDRTRKKHLGLYPKSSRPLKSRGFPKRTET